MFLLLGSDDVFLLLGSDNVFLLLGSDYVFLLHGSDDVFLLLHSDNIYVVMPRQIVASEVASLEVEVAEMEAELEKHSDSMTEEVRGKVLAATGKTKLLISQKIKQFTGLCHKNIVSISLRQTDSN